jgi:hypothetical protein
MAKFDTVKNYNGFQDQDLTAQEYIKGMIQYLRNAEQTTLAKIIEDAMEERINRALTALAYEIGRGSIKVRIS